MARRRPKRRRKDLVENEPRPKREDSSNVAAAESEQQVLESDEIRARRAPVRSYVAEEHRLKPSGKTDQTTDEEKEARIPFCCAVCKCSDEVKRQIPSNDEYVQPSEDNLL